MKIPNRRLKPLNFPLGVASLGAACLVGSIAIANDATVEEQIVIGTGSFLLSTDDATSATDIRSGEEVFEVPRPGLGDYLQSDVPQNITYPAALDEGTEQGRGDGNRNVSVNLRGLGKQNTLILIDGQRVAEYAVVTRSGWYAPDINSQMPTIALGSTEILLDGGSAFYGTDAVAGVVNLRPNWGFDGIKIRYNTNRFGDALGKSGDTVGLFAGAGNDSTRVIGAIEYVNRDYVSDADIGRSDYSTDLSTNPRDSDPDVNIPASHDIGWKAFNGANGRSTTIPDPLCGNTADTGMAAIDLGTPIAGRGPGNPQVCGYYNNFNLGLQQASTNFTALAGIEHQFSDTLSGDLLFTMGRQRTETRYQWNGVTEIDGDGGSVEAAGPFSSREICGSRNGSGNCLPIYPDHPAIQYYAQEYGGLWASRDWFASGGFNPQNYLGLETADHENDTYRLSGGLDWDITDSFTAELNVTHAVSEVTGTNRDVVVGNMYMALQGLGGPGCTGTTPGENGCVYFNPFMSTVLGEVQIGDETVNLTNSQELIDWLYPSQSRAYRNETNVIQAMISGETGLELAGGPIGIAFGYERREQESEGDFDPLMNAGGWGRQENVKFPDWSGSQDADSWFGEMVLPVLDTLTIQIAGRYEDLGSEDTFNPKVGFNWKPNDSWIIRGSWGTSFKAPSIYQTQATSFQSPGWASTGDPSHPNYRPGFGGNTRALFQEIVSPNPDLQPQESTNWSFGFDWDITDNLSVGASYVSVEFENIIYIPRPTDVFRLSTCQTGTTESVTGEGEVPFFVIVDDPACFDLNDEVVAILNDDSNQEDVTGTGYLQRYHNWMTAGTQNRDALINGVFITPSNLAFRNVEALDLKAAWFMMTDLGELSVKPNASILLEFEEKTDPGAAAVDLAGKAGPFGGGLSKYRVNVPVGLRMDNHNFVVTYRYVSEMEPLQNASFGAHHQADFNYTWTANDSYRVGLFVNNITDEVPDSLAPSQLPRDGRRVGLQFEATFGN